MWLKGLGSVYGIENRMEGRRVEKVLKNKNRKLRRRLWGMTVKLKACWFDLDPG